METEEYPSSCTLEGKKAVLWVAVAAEKAGILVDVLQAHTLRRKLIIAQVLRMRREEEQG